ncbi:hypothetical protein [Vibrio splendidus]|uniref:hypothetical protein n=1 Tax=Vibrio splendidus TaxID=29497 RepID=UPI000E09D937|nr:hypothetical protein [Vibrio splendidus]
MSILHGFSEPRDMLYKLLRDGRKCHIAESVECKFDHLFNFVVTGHSIRDWCIDFLNLDGAGKNAFHIRCNQSEYLEYCRDIANTSKHFRLSDGVRSVSNVASAQEEYVDLDGDFNKIPGTEQKKNSAMIVLPSNEEVELFYFIHGVISQFKTIFTEYDIPYDKEKMHLNYLVAVHI